jgi:hypothetical protein
MSEYIERECVSWEERVAEARRLTTEHFQAVLDDGFEGALIITTRANGVFVRRAGMSDAEAVGACQMAAQVILRDRTKRAKQ